MRDWLKKLRENKKYTQTHMAELMGMSRQYYSFIENGDRMPDLTLSTAVKISDIFHISLNQIKKYEEGKGNENKHTGN